MLCVAVHAFQSVAKFYDDHIKRKDYNYGDLPPHIIAKILSQLRIQEYRNASIACKSWYYASYDPVVARNIRVTIGYESTDCNYIARPMYNACFNGINWNKLQHRKVLKNVGSTITDLQIYSTISFTRLFEMFVYLPNVRSFKLSDSSRYLSPQNLLHSRIYTKYKDVIFRNLAQIKKIDIYTGIRNFKFYRLFLSYCINVEELNWTLADSTMADYDEFLYNCLLNPVENPALYQIIDLGFNIIDRKQNSKFFEKMIKLELINLRRLTISEISSIYYDIMFKEFCKTYTLLDSLTITGCNEQHLTDICQHMRNLKCLTINCCTANNLAQLLNLPKLEELQIDRIDIIVNDELLVLLSCERKLLKRFHINKIDANLLKLLCENYKNLEDLSINELETQDCEPIFRNMVKLKKLSLSFVEYATKNSSRLRSSDRYNVTNLTQLEVVYVNCYVPGITPELIHKLPKLRETCDYIWDPPIEEEAAPVWIEDLGNPDPNQVQEEILETGENEIVVYDISDFDWCQELRL